MYFFCFKSLLEHASLLLPPIKAHEHLQNVSMPRLICVVCDSAWTHGFSTLIWSSASPVITATAFFFGTVSDCQFFASLNEPDSCAVHDCQCAQGCFDNEIYLRVCSESHEKRTEAAQMEPSPFESSPSPIEHTRFFSKSKNASLDLVGQFPSEHSRSPLIAKVSVRANRPPVITMCPTNTLHKIR